jgi:hypothetical protein
MTIRLVMRSGPTPTGSSTSGYVPHPPVPRWCARRRGPARGVDFLNAPRREPPWTPVLQSPGARADSGSRRNAC